MQRTSDQALSSGTKDLVPTSGIQRLNWGCGSHVAVGWINSDIKESPEIDLVADISRGLPLSDNSIEYAVSVHALPELQYEALVPALQELNRVLKPGGVLRLVLPDLEKAITAYIAGDHEYFDLVAENASSLGGKLVTQILWYGYSRSLFTEDFISELLDKAGYVDLATCSPHETSSRFPGIVELDNRESESLYIEAVKRGGERRQGLRRYYRRSSMAATLEVLEISKRDPLDAQLKAAHLDGPQPSQKADSDSLRVVGWVVGSESPVEEVEVVSDHKIVAKASVDIPRPGVSEQFPDVPGADAAGFDMSLVAAGKGVSELLVSAVLADGARAQIATIQVDVTRRGIFSRLFE